VIREEIPVADYTQVAAALRAAPTPIALVAEAQRIQHVPGTSDQERLGRIVKRRLDEFKAHHQ